MSRIRNEPAVVIGVLAAIVSGIVTKDWISVVPLVSGFLTRFFVWGPKSIEIIEDVVDILHEGLHSESEAA